MLVCFSDCEAGAHTAPYRSPEKHLGGPHPGVIQSAVHPSDNWSPLAPSTPLGDLCVSALVDSCPSPALLTFTLMFNPILTVSSFSPRSRSTSHEYPKVCLLDRIIPLFKATGDDSPQETHSMDLLLTRFVSLAFLYSHSLLSLSPWAFTKHIDPPDRGVHLLRFIEY